MFFFKWMILVSVLFVRAFCLQTTGDVPPPPRLLYHGMLPVLCTSMSSAGGILPRWSVPCNGQFKMFVNNVFQTLWPGVHILWVVKRKLLHIIVIWAPLWAYRSRNCFPPIRGFEPCVGRHLFRGIPRWHLLRVPINLCYRLMCVGVDILLGRRFKSQIPAEDMFVSTVFFRRVFILWISIPWMHSCVASLSTIFTTPHWRR